MTTIAYDHKSKTIAWDGRSTTAEGMIITDEARKMHEADGLRFWISGSVSDIVNLIDCYLNKAKRGRIEGNGFVLDDGELYVFGCDGGLWVEPIESNHSIGSGSNFALSAMKLGLSAKEAVEHAKTLDCYTGGEVKEFKVG